MYEKLGQVSEIYAMALGTVMSVKSGHETNKIMLPTPYLQWLGGKHLTLELGYKPIKFIQTLPIVP